MPTRPSALASWLTAIALSVGGCATSIALSVGCATSDPVDTGAGGGATSTSTGGVCRLYDCGEDLDCAGCSGGRDHCLLGAGRCVSCDDEGVECIPVGATCPLDGFGEPDITCASSADCVACDAQHQVCDPGSARCVACTPEDTGACYETDQCVDHRCTGVCPEGCSVDDECAQCGVAGQIQHACHQGFCAECSPTYACPAGKVCGTTGVCEILEGGGGDLCAHDLCAEGEPLDAGCDACTAVLCAADAYCCDTAWDAQCVKEVGDHCGTSC